MTPWVQRGSEACLAEYFQRIGEVPGSPVELGLQIIPVGPAEQAAERRPCVPPSPAYQEGLQRLRFYILETGYSSR